MKQYHRDIISQRIWFGPGPLDSRLTGVGQWILDIRLYLDLGGKVLCALMVL